MPDSMHSIWTSWISSVQVKFGVNYLVKVNS